MIRSLPPTLNMSVRVISIGPSEVRIVRLVALITGHAAGAVGGDDLRKRLGLPRVLFVATCAEGGNGGQFGAISGGNVGALCQRSPVRSTRPTGNVSAG